MRTARFVLLALGLALAGAASAQIHLSGVLSGTLGPGQYLVDSTIVVDAGTTLTIQPGAHLSFTGWYPFKINGVLLAQGTAADSIIFDNYTANPYRWHGLRFNGSEASGSRLSYCRISGGKAETFWPENSGGGLFAMSCAPRFEHCRISANNSSMYGAGVYCYNAPVTFIDCAVESNACSNQGGGIYASLSALIIDRCDVSRNTAGSGTGGGMVAISSAMTVRDSRFSTNTAGTTGGLHLSGNPSATFTNCLVDHNSSTGG
jgi:hypothetical protein